MKDDFLSVRFILSGNTNNNGTRFILANELKANDPEDEKTNDKPRARVKRVQLDLAQAWNRSDIVEYNEMLGHITETLNWEVSDGIFILEK